MSNFRPDTGGRRWSLVRVRWFSPAAGRAGRCRQISLACVGSTYRVPATLGLPCSRVCAFPLYAAQAPGCSIWSGPCVACVWFQFAGVPQKCELVAPVFCAFPSRSSSASQELDGHTLPGCGAPSPLRGPSLSFCAHPSGACALCLAATLPADVDHPESQEVFG